MEELPTLAALWLASNVGLPVADAHPDVVTAPVEEVSRVRAELAAEEGDASTPNYSMAPAELFAFHHLASRTIYLTDVWRPDTATHISHELFHHLQAKGGLVSACSQQREKVAYDPQDPWVRQVGSSLEDAFGIDPMTRLARAVCALSSSTGGGGKRSPGRRCSAAFRWGEGSRTVECKAFDPEQPSAICSSRVVSTQLRYADHA